jgi:hypothetical protein
MSKFLTALLLSIMVVIIALEMAPLSITRNSGNVLKTPPNFR